MSVSGCHAAKASPGWYGQAEPGQDDVSLFCHVHLSSTSNQSTSCGRYQRAANESTENSLLTISHFRITSKGEFVNFHKASTVLQVLVAQCRLQVSMMHGSCSRAIKMEKLRKVCRNTQPDSNCNPFSSRLSSKGELKEGECLLTAGADCKDIRATSGNVARGETLFLEEIFENLLLDKTCSQLEPSSNQQVRPSEVLQVVACAGPVSYRHAANAQGSPTRFTYISRIAGCHALNCVGRVRRIDMILFDLTLFLIREESHDHVGLLPVSIPLTAMLELHAWCQYLQELPIFSRRCDSDDCDAIFPLLVVQRRCHAMCHPQLGFIGNTFPTLDRRFPEGSACRKHSAPSKLS